MNFKFLNNEKGYEDVDGPMEYIDRVPTAFDELYIEEAYRTTRLSVDNRPAVFLNLSRDRDTISEQEWNGIIQRQRTLLIEHMFQQGMIIHTIVSQDDNGLTLRTEILF